MSITNAEIDHALKHLDDEAEVLKIITLPGPLFDVALRTLARHGGQWDKIQYLKEKRAEHQTKASPF